MSAVLVIYQVTNVYLADWYVSRHICAVKIRLTIHLVTVHMLPRPLRDRPYLVSLHFLPVYYARLMHKRQCNGIDIPARHTAYVC
jgi:hypothetical protein